MAVVSELGKGEKVLEISGEASVDLSSSQYCFVVVTTSQSSGRFKVSLPSGQGVQYLGILQNAPAAGAQADVRIIGTTKVKANAAFDAGKLLTPAAATGKAGAAASGDYTNCQALQAASAANHLVWCSIGGPCGQIN